MISRSLVATAGFICLFACFLVFAQPGSTTAQDNQDQPASSKFLNRLKPGQSVGLKEVEGRFSLTVFPGRSQIVGHRVVFVAEDHIVVKDLAGVTETAIPVYSVTSIVTVRVGEK